MKCSYVQVCESARELKIFNWIEIRYVSHGPRLYSDSSLRIRVFSLHLHVLNIEMCVNGAGHGRQTKRYLIWFGF